MKETERDVGETLRTFTQCSLSRSLLDNLSQHYFLNADRLFALISSLCLIAISPAHPPTLHTLRSTFRFARNSASIWPAASYYSPPLKRWATCWRTVGLTITFNWSNYDKNDQLIEWSKYPPSFARQGRATCWRTTLATAACGACAGSSPTPGASTRVCEP